MAETVNNLVVGHFKYLDDTRNAIRGLYEKGIKFEQIELFSPMPEHSLEDELYAGRSRSPVRLCTLLGALAGLFGAFLMTIWMSVDYPVRVSAKPLISIPAFVVIAFECLILIGSIVNMLSMFGFSRIPSLATWPGFRPQFTEGTFGLTIKVPEDDSDSIKKFVENAGAQEVEVVYVR